MKYVVINKQSKHYSITGVSIGISVLGVSKGFSLIGLKPVVRRKIKLCTGEVVNMRPEHIRAYE